MDSQTGTLTTGRLPTGVRIDPAGRSFDVGSFPLNAVLSPDRRQVVLLLNGWREQGVQIVDRATGAVVQTLAQPAAFLGLAFSPDGRTLYASGGNQDVVYCYSWTDGRAALTDSVVLENHSSAATDGRRYPAGLAPSADGHTLYVAENLGDSLAVVNLSDRRVTQRVPAGRYPYAVTVASDGRVFVSAWGGQTVSIFAPNNASGVTLQSRVAVSRHPSALLLTPDGNRLFVASASTDRIDVIDTRSQKLIGTLTDPPGSPTSEGSTPNALAWTTDGARLLVAEADNNAIALFSLDSVGPLARHAPLGRIPAGWYPSAVLAVGDTILVVNGKGRGTEPNPATGPHPGRHLDPTGYTLGQLSGTLTAIPLPTPDVLATYTDRVAHLNNWDAAPTGGNARRAYPPFEHVIYIIKENRTYDQILGDLDQADGDSAIVFFPRPISPNHHALAERFGIWDRFFVNAEVSADGHNWSTAGYVTDYTEKTVPSLYSNRGRTFDYQGSNRDTTPPDDDDVASPSAGYLWDLAVRKGVSVRDYGEFAEPEHSTSDSGTPTKVEGVKPALRGRTNPDFATFDLGVPDQRRADVWIAELGHFVQTGSMPALEIVSLPNDHTAGAAAGAPTPRAYMADNDLALGRMIEALSKSPFWRTTVVFVLEDDAQSGADHVDSHRSPLLVISPYSHRQVFHRFANTTDVLATIEEILGLGALSPYDYFGRPLRDAFDATPEFSPYLALTPEVDLNERNPAKTTGARESARLDLTDADRADETLFNHVLWRAIKGPGIPEPGPRRASTAELIGPSH